MSKSTLAATLIIIVACLAAGERCGADDCEPAFPAPAPMNGAILNRVHFVPNAGQWPDESIRFALKTGMASISFRRSSFRIHAVQIGGATNSPDSTHGPAPWCPEDALAELEVTFPRSNAVDPQGADLRAARLHYYTGAEEREWRRDVPTFGAIVYRQLYDGVELRVAPLPSALLKYEFRVAAGADWTQIEVDVGERARLCAGDSGDLRIETSCGTLVEAAPSVWQDIAGERIHIAARFELIDERSYRFVLDDPVSPDHELVIDPELRWVHYVGGSDGDLINAAWVGEDGVYVAGSTLSADFERRINEYRGRQDAFVAQLDESGEVVWVAYCGGSALDFAYALCQGADSDLYAAGYTQSTDFAGALNSNHGGPADAFVLRMDRFGSLIWMRYLGGDSNEIAYDLRGGASGEVVAVGFTSSGAWEGQVNAYHGAGDAFIVRLAQNGEIVWMRFVGGSGADFANGVALDASDNAYLCGYLSSQDLEGARNAYHGGIYDAFAVRVNPGGGQVWAAYVGGSDIETGYDVEFNGQAGVVLIGSTQSPDFFGQSNSFIGGANDAFIVNLDVTRGSQRFMRFFGGTRIDVARAVFTTAQGRVLLAGWTSSTDFEGARNRFAGGVSDAFIAEVTLAAQVDWMFYVGGNDEDRGMAIAAAPDGTAYLAGRSESSSLIGQRNTPHGNEEGFLAQVSGQSGRLLLVTPSCPQGGPIEIEWQGATLSGPIALLSAPRGGSYRISGGGLCAGTILDLDGSGLRVVFTGVSGPDGSRRLLAEAGPAACGAFLQMLDLSTCGPSNPVRIE